MAQISIPGGGAGGAASDECTATTNYVFPDYTAVTKDSNDEAVAGTMPVPPRKSTVTLTAADGRKVVQQNGSTDACWTVKNSDNVTRSLIKIPESGYYSNIDIIGVEQSKMASCGGLTAAKILSGQSAFGINGTATSDGTITAAYVYTGKIGYSKGVKITGSMTISSVVSFSIAAYSTNQVTATWKNPAKGPYSGVIIRYKTGSYPTSVTDGTQGYKGVGTNSSLNGSSTATIGSLTAGTTYYFRIWMYCTTSAGTLYSSYISATGKPTAKGTKTFTSSQTWTVPAGVRSIDVFCVGGGGGGTTGGYSGEDEDTYYGGGAGAGGYTKTVLKATVTPGQQFQVTIGAGGVLSKTNKSGNGGATSFGSLCTANGGGGAVVKISGGDNGGSGGSGGGGGGYYYDSTRFDYGGNGGSNGGNGASTGRSTGGKGQGTTTRAFGEAAGTLYAGGGVGGTPGQLGTGITKPGAGGGGAMNSNGAANTGGGAGGSGGNNSSYKSGGSGIAIVRWGY